MDGTLGSQTAWMLDGSGVQITSGDELAEIVRAGAEAGWPVGVHAIGDRANREALDAFERTRDVWQPRGLRQRIEHAQCLAPEDRRPLRRARRRGVGAVHACAVRRAAREALLGGQARRRRTRSGRCSTRARCVANGSDAPVEELDPWAGVVAGVARPLARGPAARRSSRRCTRPASRRRGSRTTSASAGRSFPGRLADLVVLDRDPFACDREELAEVQVVATMVGGRWMHNPPPWDCSCDDSCTAGHGYLIKSPHPVLSIRRRRTMEAGAQAKAASSICASTRSGCRRSCSSRSRTWRPAPRSRTRSTSPSRSRSRRSRSRCSSR